MKKKSFIALYRVSTGQQQDSGLGLKAQRQSVLSYINTNGVLLKEFTEIESGANKDKIQFGKELSLESLLRKRPILLEVINLAKQTGSTIVVKESSRLTRFKLLGEYLMATGVDFICADSPNDSKLIISIKIAINEEEALRISERTSLALRQKVKQDGKHWGENSAKMQRAKKAYATGKIAAKGREVYSTISRNNPNNKRAASMICSKIKEGMNYSQVALFLTANGFQTARNKEFKPMQVKRIFERFC